MMYRALLVFLVVINVGVAAWWALRSPPPAEAAVELPAGVPRLQLLAEVPARARPAAPAPVVTVAAAPSALPDDARCIAFGPFSNPALLRRASDRLQTLALRSRVREIPVGTPRGWRVFVPPFATRDEAQALADRMTAAGLDDLLVMPTGPDRNGVALGRFGNEDAARRRQAQLQAAGFSAQVSPIGVTKMESWIDAAFAPAVDTAVAKNDLASPQARAIDCADLQPPAP